jgi:hypothetical protein
MKTRFIILAAFFVAFFLMMAVENSLAFRVSGASGNPIAGPVRLPNVWPPFLHFDLREFRLEAPDCRVPFTVNPANNDGVAIADVRAAADASFQSWTNAPPGLITLFRQPLTSALSVMVKDGLSLVYWAPGNQDDVPLIPVGQGQPNQNCVQLLGGGTTPGGDDVVAGGWITTGPNGICQSAAIPPDVQIIPVDNGAPDQPCVGPGANGVLETKPAGNDTYAGDFTSILTGPDGICDTPPNAGTIDYVAITACYHSVSTGVIFESDIHMNDNCVWNIGDEDPPNNRYDIQVTLTHEAGHFIGLMHSEVDAATMSNTWPHDLSKRSLEQDDIRGCDFLYTHDLGDAPDDPYPSLVHNGAGRVLNGVELTVPDSGAEHIFGYWASYQYEWLGDRVDDHPDECESRQIDKDQFDDGVAFAIVAGALQMDVTVKTSLDAAGNSHAYAAPPAGHHLYLNIWVDWNNDGDWDDGGEHVVGPGEIVDPRYPGQDSTHRYTVPIPPGDTDTWWIRVRLDWGEDCGVAVPPAGIDGTLAGPRGAAQFGEVEDTIIVLTDLWGCCHLYTYCEMMSALDCMTAGGDWYPSPPYRCNGMTCYILCGDCNGDGVINSADVVYLINYLFKGRPAPDPSCVGDVNCDGVVNSADVVYLINYLFKGGPPPCPECCPEPPKASEGLKQIE